MKLRRLFYLKTLLAAMLTRSVAVAKKAGYTAYDVWYSCRTEPLKIPRRE